MKAADKMRYKIPVGIPLGSQGGKRTALTECEETERSGEKKKGDQGTQRDDLEEQSLILAARRAILTISQVRSDSRRTRWSRTGEN